MNWRISANRDFVDAARGESLVTSGTFEVKQRGRVSITVTGVARGSRPFIHITPPARKLQPELLVRRGEASNAVTVSFTPVENGGEIYGFAVTDRNGAAKSGYEIEFSQDQ